MSERRQTFTAALMGELRQRWLLHGMFAKGSEVDSLICYAIDRERQWAQLRQWLERKSTDVVRTGAVDAPDDESPWSVGSREIAADALAEMTRLEQDESAGALTGHT